CFPKEILELMNVPGLTKAQVASHLQKCRRNNWRVSEKRKYIRHPSHQAPSSGAQQRSSFRKFGTMPRPQTDVSNLQHNPDQTQRVQEFPFPTLNTDSIFAREESSIQQLYSPQLQVQPHYLRTDNLFNNQFLFVQNNIGGGLQQQHEIIFKMLGSQGLHEPIIGNSNYRPSLTFDSGHHHIQSYYNLDLDKAHGTTYSGSEIMFDTDVGNARVNDYKLNFNMENNYKSALTFDSGYHC
ncbi:hypothetical protein HAX54_024312, partial [Datura stramonium]|nr:hypothetical protein [Datura stramonium]